MRLLACLHIYQIVLANLKGPPGWASKPVEVHQYWEATEALKAWREVNTSADILAPVSIEDDPLANRQVLRGIFA